MKTAKLKSIDLIDQASEIHYAYHKSLASITSPHTHDFYEIFLITKGEAVHRINSKEKIIGEGDLVFIRPDDMHYYEKSGSHACELINIAFSSSTMFQLFDYFGEGFNPERLLNSADPPIVRLGKIEKEMLMAHFEKINLLRRTNKKKIRTEFRIILAGIFSMYFNEEKDFYKDGMPPWLSKLKSEMEQKENFIAGIKRMYELCGKSHAHISRSFKKFLNESPTDYITNLRLNYAANLLSNSDESITNIAMESGFENLSHFYHLFKNKFNGSPKEFRKKHQKSIIPF